MAATYTDDLSIVNDEELWRRIPEVWVIEDRVAGGIRIASAAFDDHPNGTPMSVLLGTVVRESGRTPESVLMPSYNTPWGTLWLWRNLSEPPAHHSMRHLEPAPDAPETSFAAPTRHVGLVATALPPGTDPLHAPRHRNTLSTAD